MSKTTSASNGGVSMIGLLGVILVVLKLLGKISISWWWVTLPFWGGFALVVAFLVVALAIGIIGGLIK